MALPRGGLVRALVVVGAWAYVCLGGGAGCRARPPTPAASSPISPAPRPAVVLSPSPHDGGSAPAGERCEADGGTGDLEAERDAVARALATDPDDPEALANAADLYINKLVVSTDHSEIGLLFARRAIERLSRRAGPHPKKTRKPPPFLADPLQASPSHKDEPPLLARLTLLEGQALLDLGRATEALHRLDAALKLSDTAEVRYERAVALFELCRFAEARHAFESWLARYPDDKQVAWTRYHLGLTMEMQGEFAAAEREILAARKLLPDQFPEPLPIDSSAFRAIVDAEAKGLPPESAADLQLVHLETVDLPDPRDLTLEESPLSPTIVGLFRGLPLGQEPSEARAIVLYRKNLLRAVRSHDELVAEVRKTLLHELGHLRGADENDLRKRGLE